MRCVIYVTIYKQGVHRVKFTGRREIRTINKYGNLKCKILKCNAPMCVNTSCDGRSALCYLCKTVVAYVMNGKGCERMNVITSFNNVVTCEAVCCHRNAPEDVTSQQRDKTTEYVCIN